jgi:hypothetical protein
VQQSERTSDKHLLKWVNSERFTRSRRLFAVNGDRRRQASGKKKREGGPVSEGTRPMGGRSSRIFCLPTTMSPRVLSTIAFSSAFAAAAHTIQGQRQRVPSQSSALPLPGIYFRSYAPAQDLKRKRKPTKGGYLFIVEISRGPLQQPRALASPCRPESPETFERKGGSSWPTILKIVEFERLNLFAIARSLNPARSGHILSDLHPAKFDSSCSRSSQSRIDALKRN